MLSCLHTTDVCILCAHRAHVASQRALRLAVYSSLTVTLTSLCCLQDAVSYGSLRQQQQQQHQQRGKARPRPEQDVCRAVSLRLKRASSTADVLTVIGHHATRFNEVRESAVLLSAWQSLHCVACCCLATAQIAVGCSHFVHIYVHVGSAGVDTNCCCNTS